MIATATTISSSVPSYSLPTTRLGCCHVSMSCCYRNLKSHVHVACSWSKGGHWRRRSCRSVCPCLLRSALHTSVVSWKWDCHTSHVLPIAKFGQGSYSGGVEAVPASNTSSVPSNALQHIRATTIEDHGFHLSPPRDESFRLLCECFTKQ